MVAFVASTVLTAANLNTAFNALTIRTVTLTSDTLLLADNGGAVTYSNASATTSTIPPNSSVAYAVGTKIILANLGAGVVTVTAGVGVTVNGTLTIAQNAGGTCLKTATNTWSFLPFGSAGAATLTSADVTSTTGSPTITTSGANTIYSFTGSGTIVLGKAGLCDCLVLGAGGGGAIQYGGGGGAGGYLELTGTAFLPAGTLTVTIAGGGAAGFFGADAGRAGATSRLNSYFSSGGGGGGSDTTNIGDNGLLGSSGGGGSLDGTGGTGTGGLGNTGGNGQRVSGLSAGGGGGAGAVGGNAAGSGVGGAGGAGTSSSITGSSVTRGGGGGGAGTTGGAGGSGGGGAGGSGGATGSGTAGTINTGGGGGSQAAGGSGIVIIRVVT